MEQKQYWAIKERQIEEKVSHIGALLAQANDSSEQAAKKLAEAQQELSDLYVTLAEPIVTKKK